MPRFRPFAGIRYHLPTLDLSAVIAPPYDVITERDRDALEALDPFNAVRLELPRDEPPLDRYSAAAARFAEWSSGGPLHGDDEPSLYGYRMTFTDDSGRARTTTGVLGALGLEAPGAGVLPHERTTPKDKRDRLDLLRATRVNLSPVWGLSLAPGLTSALGDLSLPADAGATADGVKHELWRVTGARAEALADLIGSAPVVIADGHHRYEVALAYQDERHAAAADQAGGGAQSAHDVGDAPWDAVLALVVELVPEQLAVEGIHRLLSGLPAGFDVLAALSPWFEPAGDVAVDGSLLASMVAGGALGLITPSGATLLKPRQRLADASAQDLDTSRLAVAIDDFEAAPVVSFQHGWAHVAAAVREGRAQAGVLCRPATVQQIAAIAAGGERMPPKTTFFTPKLATGMVFRRAG